MNISSTSCFSHPQPVSNGTETLDSSWIDTERSNQERQDVETCRNWMNISKSVIWVCSWFTSWPFIFRGFTSWPTALSTDARTWWGLVLRYKISLFLQPGLRWELQCRFQRYSSSDFPESRKYSLWIFNIYSKKRTTYSYSFFYLGKHLWGKKCKFSLSASP